MDATPHRTLEDPPLHIVLYQPEIPANTGNIARLCGAAEITLHLIHPLGLRLDVRHHESFSAYLEATGDAARIAFSRHAEKLYTEPEAAHGDHLLFGPETRGLPPEIAEFCPCRRIPIWGRVRSLNLSTSVGIAAYHWLHAMGRF